MTTYKSVHITCNHCEGLSVIVGLWYSMLVRGSGRGQGGQGGQGARRTDCTGARGARGLGGLTAQGPGGPGG